MLWTWSWWLSWYGRQSNMETWNLDYCSTSYEGTPTGVLGLKVIIVIIVATMMKIIICMILFTLKAVSSRRSMPWPGCGWRGGRSRGRRRLKSSSWFWFQTQKWKWWLRWWFYFYLTLIYYLFWSVQWRCWLVKGVFTSKLVSVWSIACSPENHPFYQTTHQTPPWWRQHYTMC